MERKIEASEQSRRKAINSHDEQMLDAQSQCVPCKLCGGKAVISDAGPGYGYNINCENAGWMGKPKCLQSGARISGWAYNVSDRWNSLNATQPDPATLAALPEVQALIAAAIETAAMVSDKIASGQITSDVTRNGKPVSRISPAMHQHSVETAGLYVSKEIRAITPANATAALASIEAAAEARGRVKGMREAAGIANECGREVDAQDGSYIRHHPLRGPVFKDAILARADQIEKDAK